MHPRSVDRPSQAQLVFPLLDTLERMDGSGKPSDVADALAEQFDVSETVQSETVQCGRGQNPTGQDVKVWQRHVRFARQRAKERGLVTSPEYGRWTLTDEGAEAVHSAKAGVVVSLIVDAHGQPLGFHAETVVAMSTVHTLACGDARNLAWIPDESIHFAVTSPPYWNIKAYEEVGGQLSQVESYEAFLDGLDDAWAECFRVLRPGGRLAINVGDVLQPRSKSGTHHVLPLHADVMVRGRRRGFHSLTGIVWHKMTNATHEQPGRGAMLGKPFQPNGIIKAENEHILFFRKPGPYRSPTADQRERSRLTREEYAQWFRPIWSDVPGASTRGTHPAPFPPEIPYRLIRMCSFADDLVLDPFAGLAATAIAAIRAGRDSICNEIGPRYHTDSIARVRVEAAAARLRQEPPLRQNDGPRHTDAPSVSPGRRRNTR